MAALAPGRSVVVLGAAGFIGLRLVQRLLADADTARLIACDNLDRGRMDDEATTVFADPRVRFVQADLTDPAAFDAVDAALGGPADEAYLLAAVVGVGNVERDPARVMRVNTRAALNTLEWMGRSRSRRLFFASTSEVYAGAVDLGMAAIPTGEDTPVVVREIGQPRMAYAVSKLWGEAAAFHLAAADGFDVVVGRFHNVYGPRMGYDHVIPQLATRIFNGEQPLRVMSPEQTRAFCHVDDAVRGTVDALRCAEATGRVVHIGNDREEVTIGDLAARLLRLHGASEEIEALPAPAGSVHRRCPDISLLRSLTGFEPQVSLDAGLHETVAWYRERHPAAAGRAG